MYFLCIVNPRLYLVSSWFLSCVPCFQFVRCCGCCLRKSTAEAKMRLALNKVRWKLRKLYKKRSQGGDTGEFIRRSRFPCKVLSNDSRLLTLSFQINVETQMHVFIYYFLSVFPTDMQNRREYPLFSLKFCIRISRLLSLQSYWCISRLPLLVSFFWCVVFSAVTSLPNKWASKGDILRILQLCPIRTYDGSVRNASRLFSCRS